MSQEGTNGLYLDARFEVLTIYSYGDINQNMVKISVIMLGTESCMKVWVKGTFCNLQSFTSLQIIFMMDTTKIMHSSFNLETNASAGPIDRVIKWNWWCRPSARANLWRTRTHPHHPAGRLAVHNALLQLAIYYKSTRTARAGDWEDDKPSGEFPLPL